MENILHVAHKMPYGGPSALDGVYSCKIWKNMKSPPEIETSDVVIDTIKW